MSVRFVVSLAMVPEGCRASWKVTGSQQLYGQRDGSEIFPTSDEAVRWLSTVATKRGALNVEFENDTESEKIWSDNVRRAENQ